MKQRILSKTVPCHALFTKKKEKNGAVLKALWVFFFPCTREAGEEEDFSSFVTNSHSLLDLKKKPT